MSASSAALDNSCCDLPSHCHSARFKNTRYEQALLSWRTQAQGFYLRGPLDPLRICFHFTRKHLRKHLRQAFACCHANMVKFILCQKDLRDVSLYVPVLNGGGSRFSLEAEPEPDACDVSVCRGAEVQLSYHGAARCELQHTSILWPSRMGKEWAWMEPRIS